MEPMPFTSEADLDSPVQRLNDEHARLMSTAIWHGSPDLDHANKMSAGSAIGHLGIELTELGANYLVGRMPVDSRTRQPFGILHGGASVLLAETLVSCAATFVAPPGKACVGMEINANHLRPVTSGSPAGARPRRPRSRPPPPWPPPHRARRLARPPASPRRGCPVHRAVVERDQVPLHAVAPSSLRPEWPPLSPSGPRGPAWSRRAASSRPGGAPSSPWSASSAGVPRRRRGRFAQYVDQPLAGRLAVGELGAVLARRDGEYAVDQPRRQPVEQPGPDRRADPARVRHVVRELDPAVRGVHALPSRPTRPREPLLQLAVLDGQRARDDQVVHSLIVDGGGVLPCV